MLCFVGVKVKLYPAGFSFVNSERHIMGCFIHASLLLKNSVVFFPAPISTYRSIDRFFSFLLFNAKPYALGIYLTHSMPKWFSPMILHLIIRTTNNWGTYIMWQSISTSEVWFQIWSSHMTLVHELHSIKFIKPLMIM